MQWLPYTCPHETRCVANYRWRRRGSYHYRNIRRRIRSARAYHCRRRRWSHGDGYSAYTLCDKTFCLCPPKKRESQSTQGPGWDQELAPDPAPPRWHYVWRHTPRPCAEPEILRLGPRWPGEVSSPWDRKPHEVEHHGGGDSIRAMEVVAWSGKGRAAEPTLGAAFPPYPTNHFCHQAVALPSAWWVFMGRGAYPHHGRLDSSRLPASIQRRGPRGHIGRKGQWLAITEAMKKKYKLEKRKRDYAISSIKDKVVRMAT